MVEMQSPKLCKPPTRFAEIKTDTPNLYKPPTCFEVIKTPTPLATDTTSQCILRILTVQ